MGGVRVGDRCDKEEGRDGLVPVEGVQRFGRLHEEPADVTRERGGSIEGLFAVEPWDALPQSRCLGLLVTVDPRNARERLRALGCQLRSGGGNSRWFCPTVSLRPVAVDVHAGDEG